MGPASFALLVKGLATSRSRSLLFGGLVLGQFCAKIITCQSTVFPSGHPYSAGDRKLFQCHKIVFNV